MRSEAGFTGDAYSTTRVFDLLDQGDRIGAAATLDLAIAAAPRDHRVLLLKQSILAADLSATPDGIMGCARDSLAALKLIPAGATYDAYRVNILGLVAYYASVVRTREAMAGIEPAGSTEVGRFAVAILRKQLELDPLDSSTQIRRELVNSLLTDNQLEEAATRFNEILPLNQTSADFSYLGACIESRRGYTDSALTFLRAALSRGYAGIKHVRVDPDLNNLRAALPLEYSQLTTVSYSWDIVYGVFNDDITFTNYSPFPLFNVSFKPVLTQDFLVWAPDLYAFSIQPGETYTWSNVVSIPDSRLTNTSVTLTSDQSD
jgi:hypothetical protein